MLQNIIGRTKTKDFLDYIDYLTFDKLKTY